MPPHQSQEIKEEMDLRKEMAALLNRYSRENASGTPDYILANYLGRCLINFDQTTIERETWYGRTAKPKGTIPPGSFGS